MATQEWIGGPILWILRLAHGYDQETMARRVNLDRSYVSRIERGKRRPSAQVLSAWVSACPAPLLYKELELDLMELDTDQPDWIRAKLVAVDPDDPTRAEWIRNAVHALRFRDALPLHLMQTEDAAIEALESLLWLCFRAATHHHIDLPSLKETKLWRSIEDQDFQKHYTWLGKMWEDLSDVPVTEEVPVADPLLEQFTAMWTALPESARPIILEIADLLKKHWPK